MGDLADLKNGAGHGSTAAGPPGLLPVQIVLTRGFWQRLPRDEMHHRGLPRGQPQRGQCYVPVEEPALVNQSEYFCFGHLKHEKISKNIIQQQKLITNSPLHPPTLEASYQRQTVQCLRRSHLDWTNTPWSFHWPRLGVNLSTNMHEISLILWILKRLDYVILLTLSTGTFLDPNTGIFVNFYYHLFDLKQ